MSEAQHTLEVYMLGDFSVRYDGRSVQLGKNAGAKFLSFLQMLILAGDAGITRREVIDALFAGDDLANITNSLNNLVYQSRRQLEKSGLPQETGVRKVKDRYFFISPVPPQTDVGRFSDALRQASDADGLAGAIALYRGDLLPSVTGNGQIDDARRRLRQAYKSAVHRLADIYRADGDTAALIRLYTRAEEVSVSEDGDLEAALVLALIAAGDTRAALRYYDKALRQYQSQGRGSIPEPLEACAERLSLTGEACDSANLRSQLLDVVAASADETPAGRDGALYCNYPSFIDTVRLLRRNLSRNPRPVTLMLLTLVDYEGKPLRMEKKQVHYSEALKESIRSALRIGDSFTRNDSTGFLILLPGADEENAVAIFNRISRRFKEKAGSNTAVRYRMLALNALDKDQEP